MSVFTALKLKEARISSNLSQEEVAKRMNMSRRRLASLEANGAQITVDELFEFANLYQVNVVSLILEDYEEPGEES